MYSLGDPLEGDALRYGLTDEASKLNLNTAAETNLLRLPKMTTPLIDALLDFLDADNTPIRRARSRRYYDALPHPYAIRNGPLTTVDDLLLVRGFTPSLLYGEDMNMNFTLDPNEDDSDDSFPPDNHDGRLDLGLRQYVTVSSYDLNEDKEGAPRTDAERCGGSLAGRRSAVRFHELRHGVAEQ